MSGRRAKDRSAQSSRSAKHGAPRNRTISSFAGRANRAACAALAEALGLRAEDVKPQVGDTDSVGYTDVTGGSRVTFATGWAAYEAGQDIKRQLIDRANGMAMWTAGLMGNPRVGWAPPPVASPTTSVPPSICM